MNVNKYRLAFNPATTELDFTVPVEQSWDMTGVDTGYEIYEQEAIKDVINLDRKSTRLNSSH